MFRRLFCTLIVRWSILVWLFTRFTQQRKYIFLPDGINRTSKYIDGQNINLMDWHRMIFPPNIKFGTVDYSMDIII